MEREETAIAPEEALKDIRGMMARSSRFLSLSGWSGVWAGSVGLIAAFAAYQIIAKAGRSYITYRDGDARPSDNPTLWSFTDINAQLAALAVITFILAFLGSYFFTLRKAKASGQKIWNPTSKKLMWSVVLPMLAGGVFCLSFLLDGAYNYIAPSTLVFYGLGVINGSKYTLGEIRWLGYSEVALGCICLAIPGLGLVFMALGFGVLHILYGIFMWNKYDKHPAA